MSAPTRAVPLLLSALLLSGCPAADVSVDPIPLPTRPLPQPTRQEAPARIIAMGDIHGDIEAMRTAFRLANLIDEVDAWIGGVPVAGRECAAVPG